MDKLEKTSLDITKMNIEKIKELFPNVVTEGKIDFDVLRDILGDEIDDDKEKYQFTWKGKSASIKLAQSPSTSTLRPSKEDSKDWDTTENLYIEGDNLEVLKQLQKTYYGKIKMIYIDPPYNTGNDFIYKDNYSYSVKEYKQETKQEMTSNPETDGRFHTNWINMMYPRLSLAKNLLNQEGIIFISIDDNELFNLKKICDEIFGEVNYIGNLAVENNPKGRKNSNFISVTNEYCLIYAKNISCTYFVENIPKNIKDLTLDENGTYVHNSGKRVLVGENDFNKIVTNYESSKHYSVYYKKGEQLKILKEKNLNDIDKSLTKLGYERYYSYNKNNYVENTYSEDRLKKLFEQNALEFKNSKIYEKNMSTTIRIKSIVLNNQYKAVMNNEVINYELDVKTTSAGVYLKRLFNTDKVMFENPKNIGLIKLLVTLLDDKECIVLDFFSGSATTAESIFQQNILDDGNRKFILVQYPEKIDISYNGKIFNSICTIAKERIKLARKRIKEKWVEDNSDEGLFAEEQKEFPFDIGFKVFKLDSTNILPWDNELEMDEKTLFEHSSEVFKHDRSKEDILYEILLKYGVFDMQVNEIEINRKTMYQVGKRFMIVCLEDEVTNDDIKEITKQSPKTVIFKESGFKNDNDKINAIYNLEKAGVEDIKCI